MAQHDDKQAERAKRESDKRARQFSILVNSGLEECLKSVAGREFIWWLLGVCGVGGIPWASTDRDTAFKIGELNVGQQLLALIAEIDPLAYALMQKEHIERDRSFSSATDDTSGGRDSAPGDTSA